MRHRFALFAVLVAALAADATPLRAQARPDSVRAELERLRARIDSLEAVIRRLGETGVRPAGARDELSRLRAAAEAAADEGDAGRPAADSTREFQGRQRSLQALNPEISVNADVFAHVDMDEPGRDNFVPREVEISLQSALDPFSRAKIFASHHSAGPETSPFGEHGHGHGEEAGEEEGEEEAHADEGGFSIEEGYVEWVGLPAGLNLKVGKFFQRFGALNRWHAHALPFQSRSLPHLAFLGEEALAQAGASLSWLVPVAGAGTYDLTFEATRSTSEPLFGESRELSLLAHVNGFWQLSRSTDLDLGLSWTGGDYADEVQDFGRNLWGVEAALTWRPPARSRNTGLTLRGGAMLLDGLVASDPAAPPDELRAAGEGDALGVWSMAEWRLSTQWLVGARFDWTENAADPDETAWIFSPTLTWWQSEFVRLRLEYDVLGRSFGDDEGRLWVQATFAMGPHKHENY